MIESVVRGRLLGHAPLTALVGSRVYAGRAPADAALPFVVCSRIAGVRPTVIAGAALVERATLQVDCYALQYRAAALIARRAEEAMIVPDFNIYISVDSIVDAEDAADPAIYRRILTITVTEAGGV